MGSASTYFTDYQEISGVKFPFKISQTMGPRKFDFLVKEIKVSTLIIGYDHQFGRNREGNFEYLKEHM